MLFAVFVLGPVLFSFGMSFTNWDGLGRPTFTGLRNYGNLLTDDLFRTAVRNTFLYSIGTVLPMLAISLGLAMMLDSSLQRAVVLPGHGLPAGRHLLGGRRAGSGG